MPRKSMVRANLGSRQVWKFGIIAGAIVDRIRINGDQEWKIVNEGQPLYFDEYYAHTNTYWINSTSDSRVVIVRLDERGENKHENFSISSPFLLDVAT